MSQLRDRRAHRWVQLLGAAMAAGLLGLSLVVPTLGAAVGPTKLEQPAVTPRSGTTATQLTFSVFYRSAQGSAPDYVRVLVGSTTYPMSATTSDWKKGVEFTARTTLPAGTMRVRFEARDSEKFIDQADGGTVTIEALDPTPTPEPTPTPTPTPIPTPTPEPTPLPTPLPTPTPTPTTVSTGGSAASPTTTPTTSPGGTSGSVDGSPDDPQKGPRRPATGSAAATDPDSDIGGSGSGGSDGSGGTEGSGGTIGSGGSTTGSGGRSGSGGSGTGNGSSTSGTGSQGAAEPAGPFAPWIDAAFGGQMAALGLQRSGSMPTLPAMVVSSVAVSTWMAFMLFNKKRRDEEPPESDVVLRAYASVGIAVAPHSGLAEPVDPESMMPRWRRPSLIMARKIDPIRTSAEAAPPMVFQTHASGGDVERRQVRYTVAALLDHPDELRSARISEVAAGDELQVEARSGAFCQVVCPDGRRGWIHRTALSDRADPNRPPWIADDLERPAEAENALAALLAARGFQRSAV